MKVVEILINNQVIDLSSDTDFPLILANNVYYDNEVSSRGGEYSYTVQFPFTINNSNIFKLNNIYEQPNKFYRDNLYDSIIYVNSIKVFQGVFSINSFNRDFIEGKFKSNNIAWASLIGNKSLRDIESFDDYPFNGTLTVYDNMIDQFIESDPSVYNHNRNYDVCFPLVARGQYFIPYFSKSKSFIDTTRYDSLALGGNRIRQYNQWNGFGDLLIRIQNESIRYSWAELNHLDYEDFPPSFYVVNILQKIFKDIGYSISGSWINDPQINRLILPASLTEDIVYNIATLCNIRLNLLTDILINTREYLVFPYSYPANSKLQSTQINNKVSIIPLPPPGFPNLNPKFPTGILYSMNTLGFRGLNTNGNVSLKDVGFNLGNPYDYGDFFVPEDGIYELSYNVSGFINVIDNGDISGMDFNEVYMENLVGFFYINDIEEPPNVIEKVDYILPFNHSTSGNIKVLVEPKPFISAIPGATYYSTYDVINFDYKVGQPVSATWTPQAFNVAKTVRVELKKGEILRFMLISNQHNQNPFFPGLNPPNIDGSYDCNYTVKINSGSNFTIKNISGDVDFKIAKNLPNVKQIDFIKSLITMFNLYFTVDINSKIIFLEKRDNWYLNPSVALDLTSLCDIRSSNIEQIEIPYIYDFKYKDDSKDYLKELDNELYNYRCKTISSNKEIEEVNVIFTDTRSKKFFLVRNDNKANPPNWTTQELEDPRFSIINEIEMPFIGDEFHHDSVQFDKIDPIDKTIIEKFKTWKYNNNIRILKVANSHYDLEATPLVGRGWLTTMFLDQEFIFQMEDIPRAVFVEEDNTYLNDYQLDSLDWESLYNKNWYNFILNQQRSERLVLNAEIDFNVYNMLAANRLIKIEGNYYYLEKFSGYNVINNEMTQLSLIKKTNS